MVLTIISVIICYVITVLSMLLFRHCHITLVCDYTFFHYATLLWCVFRLKVTVQIKITNEHKSQMNILESMKCHNNYFLRSSSCQIVYARNFCHKIKNT